MKWPWPIWNRSRWVKWTLGLGIALSGYTLVGCLVLPGLIKWQLCTQLAAATQRSVAVQQVRLNPFTLRLTVRGCSVTESNGAVFGSFDELSAQLRFTSLFRRALIIKELNLHRPVASLIVPSGGTVTNSNLVNAAPWVVVEQLNIEAGELLVDDAERQSPLQLSQINLHLSGLSLPTHRPVTTVLSLVCNATGIVALEGTIDPATQSADVLLQVTDLDLRALQPYVAEIWNLEITGGTLQVNGRVRSAAGGPGGPRVHFTGALGVADFASVDAASHEEFLQWEALTLSGVDLRYQPHGVEVAAVELVGVQGNLFIRPDRTSNLHGLLQNAEKLHALIVQLQLNKLFPFEIGAATFTRGSLRFTDHSIAPPVATEIQEVAGTLTGVSSLTNATLRVDLHGSVDGNSPLAISGTIQPLAAELRLDLTLTLQNGELATISPYAAKYVGYPIHRGQLAIAAHYAVRHRRLQAENQFTARQLRLGAQNDSPDAFPLRIKLAIALLQDREGVLTFELPVTGDLDDPQFQLGPLITQVYENFIEKAVSNPFALLGSLLGSDEQLSFVEFPPGGATLTPAERQKLDTLARALAERPALELEITGAVDTTSDRLALATIKLREFKSRWTTDTGATPISGAAEPSIETEPTQNFGPLRPATEESLLIEPLSLPVAEAYANLRFTETEETIIAAIEVTPADFRALGRARADKVRQYLLASGQVSAERLFINTPPAFDSSYQGQSRVNLSLH